MLIDAPDSEEANPAHCDIDGGIQPFWGVNPDGSHQQPGKGKAPHDSTQGNALPVGEYQKADGGIAPGNQEINHDMVEFF